MTVAAPPSPQCRRQGCRAVPLAEGGVCFRHADGRTRRAELERLAQGAALRFTEGLTLDAKLLAEILEAAPQTEDARRRLRVTVLLFAGLLQLWGFSSHESFGRALAFSAQSATNLVRTSPAHPLTLAGEWLQICLRLLGPLFFGLALLALRGRVKR
jgi:hypothetical protein